MVMFTARSIFGFSSRSLVRSPSLLASMNSKTASRIFDNKADASRRSALYQLSASRLDVAPARAPHRDQRSPPRQKRLREAVHVALRRRRERRERVLVVRNQVDVVGKGLAKIGEPFGVFIAVV